MALIKLTVSELEGVKSQLSNMSSKASSCASTTASVRNNLDMEITAKRNIEERLDTIKRDLTKHSESLELYANVLNDVINDFVRADSNGFNANLRFPDWGTTIGAAIGVVSAVGNISATHTGEMYKWGPSQHFKSISDVINIAGIQSPELVMFGGTGESVEISLEDVWDHIKSGSKSSSVINTLIEMFNGGELPDFLENNEIRKNGMKVIGYLSDIEKAIEAVINLDEGPLVELLGKYGIKKPLKEVIETSAGVSGFTAGVITDLIYSAFESGIDVANEFANEVVKVVTDPNSNIMDYVNLFTKAYTLRDRAIAQGFTDTVFDYMDDFGGLLEFFKITDAPDEGYKAYWTKEWEYIKKTYQQIGPKEMASCVVDGFVDAGKSIVKGVSGWFDKVGEYFQSKK